MTIITTEAGETLHFGPTTIRIVEDGTNTENRISSIVSTMLSHADGPTQHLHLMHDETFLVISGALRFTMNDVQRDVKAGEYIVAPAGAEHHFANISDESVTFFSTFITAFYIQSFRDLAQLSAEGRLSEQTEAEVLRRYATVVCSSSSRQH